MLEFLKRLLGFSPKAVEPTAPYKVETPAPVVETPVVAAPVETPSPAQVAKKAATGTGKQATRRRKKPAAT